MIELEATSQRVTLSYSGAIILPMTLIWLCLVYITKGDGLLQIIIFCLLPIYVVINKNNSFSGPYGVFVVFFAFYSVSYPGHVLLQGQDYSHSVSFSLFLHGVGLAGYITASAVNFKNVYSNGVIADSFNLAPLRWLLTIFFLISLLFVIQALLSQATTKQELNEGGASILYYGVLFYTVSAIYYIVIHYESYREKKYLFIFFNFSFFLLAYLSTGERDIIFKFVFILTIFYFDRVGEFKKIYYVPLVLIIFFILPLTQYYKAALIAEQTGGLVIESSNIFVGEFISSGRNLSKIIEISPNYYFGERAFFDVLRFLRIDTFYGQTVESTGSWFNSKGLASIGLYPNSGWGFSWIGFLYLSFGVLGVFISMLIVSAFFKYLYEARLKNFNRYIFYVFFFAIFLYVQRADLANLLGQVIKFTLVPIILISFFQRIKCNVK